MSFARESLALTRVNFQNRCRERFATLSLTGYPYRAGHLRERSICFCLFVSFANDFTGGSCRVASNLFLVAVFKKLH